MKKNKLLITGGCGYIGSHTLIAIIENSDYELISLDNHLNSSQKALDRVAEITGKKVKNYDIDLQDNDGLKQVFEENPDLLGVIHFAALKSVPESVENPILYYRNNLDGLLNLLDCCQTYGVEQFIFSSSCSVYGNPEKLPVAETAPFQAAESPYAATKQMAEQILKDFVKAAENVRCVSLRYFNPVGAHSSGKNGEDPRNPPTSLVPIIVEVAAGIREKMFVWGDGYNTRDGSCIRDYIHVMDLAEAHVQAIRFLSQNPETNYEVFNLGTGEGVTVLEAIHAFEKTTSVKLNYEIGERRAGDVITVYSDTKKSDAVLGWKAKRGIEEMMQSAWAWKQYAENA
ncbi:MAG: UDP-glucose 4-epimerase GalE [Bacteroidota bacterium]